MKRIAQMLAAAAVLTTAVPLAAQTSQDEARLDAAQRRFDNELTLYQRAVDDYRNSVRRNGGYRPGYPAGGGYYDQRDDRYPADYDWQGSYRPGGPERVLTRNDDVYYGNDGRSYCRRSDGTTGLVVGAALGGVFGNVVDGGRRRTLGTLLGGAGGALLGRSIEQNQVRCR